MIEIKIDNDNPLVSIIVPAYNAEKYIAKTLDCLIKQPMGDFEIIIVNDGSTEPLTNNLLRDYSQPKTRVIHTANQGLALARNTGIDAKLVVVGMASNDFTIADPNDKGMLDVVGFDAATPQIISDFIGYK